jgi:myo-inositol-1(or 4)-monophosphatase
MYVKLPIEWDMGMDAITPLDVMITAARSAGRLLTRRFGRGKEKQVIRKGRGDFASGADLAAEECIAMALRDTYPSYGFLMEESGPVKGRDSERCWIVDPLDGTTNFLHGISYFAVSIALRVHGKIVSAVVLDPIRDELFTAQRGEGASLNGRSIEVSSCRLASEGLIAIGIPIRQSRMRDPFPKRLSSLRSQVGGIRRMGAAALDLAYVAAGRYDAYCEEGQAPWDTAAGILLVEEAGGRCTDFEGKSNMLVQGTVLATNRHLHKDLAAIIKPLHRV